MTARPLHLHGVVLPDGGEPTDLWVVDGLVTYEPIADATTIITQGWILPGLVDAHCHVGLAAGGAVDRATAEQQARADVVTGVTVIRDAGSPIDTHWLNDLPGLPRIIRAGRHIARPKRYIRGFGVEIEPDQLVDETHRQALAGDGWVKLVGDWIDRDLGDLTPLWPDEAVRAAIKAAHQAGARVTAHCFGEESVAQLVDAGIDCVEHGCGLDEATTLEMARRGVALVPTLDNLKIFPGIADQAQSKYPRYAAHMRQLFQRRFDTLRRCLEAGVAIYAGTDAGGNRSHGTLIPEILALAKVGGAQFALGAASWRARDWLGAANLVEGAPADLIVVGEDPFVRPDLAPIVVMRDGVVCG
jgi:imidazolonepropionase-like amidohydrolase